jgi:hypothetical protein
MTKPEKKLVFWLKFIIGCSVVQSLAALVAIARNVGWL